MPKNYIKKYLSDDDLDAIVKKISESEKKTSGEIRLSIKVKKGYREKEFTPREMALKEFTDLRMHETRDKTGVLIFILFEERKFEIIADSGINSRITEDEWNDLSGKLRDHFKAARYLEGIVYVIEKIGEKLSEEFPFKSDDTNELSDEVVIN
ncbi:MAG: TPM domain-containing protein [Bacteroidetes bacterium]|nr:TPM domain-containing protein [Bacteroidota bacterium]